MPGRRGDGSGTHLPVADRSGGELTPAGGSPPPAAWGGDPASEGEGLDVRRLLYLLWLRKWWILLATALGIAVGTVALRRFDPVYETHATIWVEAEDQGSGPIQGAEVFEGRGWAELFSSLAVLRPVARDLRLFIKPSGAGEPRKTLFADFNVGDNLLTGSYRARFDSAGTVALTQVGRSRTERKSVGEPLGEPYGFRWRPTVSSAPPAGTTIKFQLTTPVQAALDLRRNLNVAYEPRAGNVIATSLTWPNPSQAAEIHNALVDQFLSTATDLKTQKLREVVNILRTQTQIAEERLRKAELALENKKVETITLPSEPRATPSADGGLTRDPVFEAYFQKKLELDELRSELSQIEDQLAEYRSGNELEVSSLQMIDAVNASSALDATLEELVERQAQRRSLLLTFTPEHPRVESIQVEISRIKSEVLPDQLEDLAQQLRNRMTRLESEIQEQTGELREIPSRTIEEERLRRDMEMAEELHNNLLVRLKEAELAASTNLPDLQVVDRASVPGSPTSNDGPLYFAMATLAGLGLGVGGVVLLDRMDSRIRYPDEVTDALGLPILGVVPRVNSENRSSAEEMHTVLEAFRSIRKQITRIEPRGAKVFSITSPEPQDGKSLVSANLAISFAYGGKRTLLIDGDVRRGNLERLFDLPAKPGLTECLEHELDDVMDSVCRQTDVENLFLLPHGRLRDFNIELLDSVRLDSLLERARSNFDAVVVDGPPLAAGAHAMVIGERSDQVLLVLRTGATDKNLTRTRLDAIGGFDLPLVGVILNDVPGSAPYYRYYSAYEYYLEGEVAGG